MTRSIVAIMTIAACSTLSLGFPWQADAGTPGPELPVVAEQGAPGVTQSSTSDRSPASSPDSAAPPSNPPTDVQPQQSNGAAGADRAAQGSGIETVVVTARRTAEDSQKVPVAISSFSGKDLQREQIDTSQDLAGRVPSLIISTGGQTRNTETPTIRGQGATFGASPGVIIYYSEVPLPNDQTSNAQGGPGKYFDLADVQVLKGSQGTLFGRNTTGGALLLEPHKPDPTLDVSIHGGMTNYEGRDLEAIVNAPLIDDELFIRLGAKWEERDGFTHDVLTNKDYDSRGYQTMRLGLLWKPTNKIQNYLLGYYTHSADNGSSTVINALNQDGFNYTFYLQAYNIAPHLLPPPSQAVANKFNLGCLFLNVELHDRSCGQSLISAQEARGVRNVSLSADPDDILNTGAVIDTFSYQFNDSLTLRNIASYSSYTHHDRWDLDGSILALDDVNGNDGVNSSNIASFTEELQLQGGAFDQQLKYVQGIYFQAIDPTGTMENADTALVFSTVDQQFAISQRSYGPYIQGTYNLGGLFDSLDGLNFTAGARYTFDDINGNAVENNVGAPSTPEHAARVKDEAPTYTFGLDYKIPTTLLYGKISHGYKSGGFEPTAVNPADYTFKPEFVTTYEAGHKSDFRLGDSPVRINSAVYFTQYTDMQRASPDVFVNPTATNPLQATEFGGATYNAGKAIIAGYETDATIQPLDGLTLIATYSFTYAKYEQYNLVAQSVGTPFTDCSGQQIPNGNKADLSCIPFAHVPKHQFSISSRYQVPLDESVGKVSASATFSWTDRQYGAAATIPEAEPGAWLDSFGLLNASVDWSHIWGTSFDLSFRGTNLTDRTYRISNSNVWETLNFRSSVYGEPRIFGMQLSYAWGA